MRLHLFKAIPFVLAASFVQAQTLPQAMQQALMYTRKSRQVLTAASLPITNCAPHKAATCRVST